MPLANSEGYVSPTNEEQAAFAGLVSTLETRDLIRSARLATENHYTLVNYIDRGDDNAVSYLLREEQPIRRGWGLYAFRVDSASHIIIQAPHPLYDDRTPSVALNIYRALDAHALLVAGAHRNANRDGSADVAHEENSIFHSIQTALFKEIQAGAGNPVVLQIHGFADDKHPNYPRVVLGAGKKIESFEMPILEKLGDALISRGVSVGICDGKSWQDLCGTENAQASVVTNGLFIHIELDEKMRRDDDRLIAALVEVLGK